MSLKAVLFDLDGTLLPMDQDHFVKSYFKLLTAELAPQGYPDGKALLGGIMAGIDAMVKNDGSRTNEVAFWDRFCQLFGERAREDEPLFRRFYENEFPKAQNSCGYHPMAAEIVHMLQDAGCRVMLATNPIFPAIATEHRIRWAGLDPTDFELFTAYENSCFCKPNPAYYREIADKLGLNPAECCMVGNDAIEDTAAEALGIRVFLLTDCLINRDGRDISAYPQGSFPELMTYLKTQLA